MSTVAHLSHHANTKTSCELFGVPRATFYRQIAEVEFPPVSAPPAPPLALSDSEEHVVLEVLHEPQFHDFTIYYIYATLLDEGIYHCSIRTMYRILAKQGEVKERRRHVKKTYYEKPELLATVPISSGPGTLLSQNGLLNGHTTTFI